MSAISNWDWQTREKMIANVSDWKKKYNWVEEPAVSPDGEKIAAIVNIDEGEFNVCVNGESWQEEPVDKAWLLRFSPDGRLTAITSTMGEWTMTIDGTPWENTFAYVWNPHFSKDGKVIAAAFQQDMNYGMVINDVPWETTFPNLTNSTISEDGKFSAASVQTIPMGQGEIFKFQEGSFSAAMDGKVWDKNFVNVWDMAVNSKGTKLAAEVRLTLYDYTIAVNGEPWDATYGCVWAPIFEPKTDAVIAPVRVDGKWTLAKDGKIMWGSRFDQIWGQQCLPDGKRIAAITASDYGKWTVVVDGVPWKVTVGDMLTDLTSNASGTRLAALAKHNDKWTVLSDGNLWTNWFNRIWPPVFSDNGQYLAVKVENGGKYTLAINDKVWNKAFDALWQPVVSPDGSKILCRIIEDGKYYRRIIPVKEILG